MSYSQDPNYWTEDDPRTKSTQHGDPRLPLVKPEQKAIVRRMSDAESAALTGMTQGVAQPQTAIQLQEWEGTHTGHVRHVEDPMVNAKASLLYSWPYIILAALGIGALLWLTDVADGDPAVFIGMEIVGTVIAGYIILAWNRAQGLHHSATGIGHAELKTRERMYSRAADVEEHRIDVDAQVRIHEIDSRRAIAEQYMKRITGGDNE